MEYSRQIEEDAIVKRSIALDFNVGVLAYPCVRNSSVACAYLAYITEYVHI